MSVLDYYTPKEWELLAELDESESYEVDITEIYRNGDTFILATATGCSCWSGEYDVEEFDSLDALAASIAVTGDERRYNPSPSGAEALIAEARAKLAHPLTPSDSKPVTPEQEIPNDR